MTAPFVSSLRTRGETIRVGAPGAAMLRLRVQSADRWDTVRIEAAPTESVRAVKDAAAGALLPDADGAEDLVIKLRGFEVLDEHASLAEAGAVDGSIFLLAYRRRRPVR